jgi:hypothetical protein
MSRVTWACNIYIVQPQPLLRLLYPVYSYINLSLYDSAAVYWVTDENQNRACVWLMRMAGSWHISLHFSSLSYRLPFPHHNSTKICMIMTSKMEHWHELLAKLTPRSWVLLKKLSVDQLLKNFTIRYGTRLFITLFTCAFYWPLSWPRWIQFKPPNPFSRSWKDQLNKKKI